MRYIFIFLFFFVGCEEKKNHKTIYIEDVIKEPITKNEPIKTEKKEKQNYIKIDDLKFEILNNGGKLKYNFNSKKILVFVDKHKLSNLQITEFKKLHKKIYIIKNKKLEEYFEIVKYPTTIITKDNNKSTRYEGFIPSEILKYELKD